MRSLGADLAQRGDLTRKRVVDAESWSVKFENSSGVWTLTTIWSTHKMYSSREEQSPPAEAPALGHAERKSTTNGEDARPAGLLHEPHELSTSTLTKLEAASDEVEFQQSIWDASLFLFNPVAGRSASLFAFVLLAVKQDGEVALLVWTKSLCPGTRSQASEFFLSRGVRMPPRRRGLPVDVSRARSDDADLPRSSTEDLCE